MNHQDNKVLALFGYLLTTNRLMLLVQVPYLFLIPFFLLSFLEPSEIVLYASAERGEVGFLLPESAAVQPGEEQRDTYIVGHSLRPVGVTYDPIDKVYLYCGAQS